MSVPKYGTRVHGQKHQFYQFGFNESNSCWLDGRWVTVPKERYDAERDSWEAAHERRRDERENQHHRGKPTPIAKMTPDQRKAWESFSGTCVFEAVYQGGRCGPVRVELAAGVLTPSSIKWLRKRGARIARQVKIGNEETKQEAPGLPGDMYAEGTLNPIKWEFTPAR